MRCLAVLLLLAAVAPDAARAASSAVAEAPAPGSVAAIARGLAAHKAVYKLQLDQARGDVVAAGGSMTYEVTDACDGWAVTQRLRIMLTNRDGQDVEMLSDYTTFESKDGLRLRFRMRQTTDTAVTQQVEGSARLERMGGPGEVRYTLPKEGTQPLPAGTLFPMWHTAAIISGAEAGRKFLTLPLFDGTGPDGAQDSSIAITSWGRQEGAPSPALAALPSGKVHVAFFGRERQATMPEYEVSMRYWENGVADGLQMDFGDFVMQGKLGEFTLKPPHC